MKEKGEEKKDEKTSCTFMKELNIEYARTNNVNMNDQWKRLIPPWSQVNMNKKDEQNLLQMFQSVYIVPDQCNFKNCFVRVSSYGHYISPEIEILIFAKKTSLLQEK